MTIRRASEEQSEHTIKAQQLVFFGRVTTASGYVDLGPHTSAGELAQKAEVFAEASNNKSPLAFVTAYFGRDPTRDLGEAWWKGDFVEAEHPRQPKGVPEGGEFKGKDQASANNVTDNLINQNTVLKDVGHIAARKAARKILRARLIAGLRALAGVVADVVPYAGEVFDAYEIAQTVADFKEITKESQAAIEYVQGGPRALEDLRVSEDDQSFSSVAAFKKIGIEKFYGPAGDGYDYHHIVWQGGPNGTNIAPELLHNTENMVRVPRLLHEAITDAYSAPSKVNSSLTVRQWLDTQPYDVQRAEGIRIMRELGIIK